MSTLICKKCGEPFFVWDDKDQAAGAASYCDKCTPVHDLPEKEPDQS